jgi:hypothetical protein
LFAKAFSDILMPSEPERPSTSSDPPADHGGADEGDLILQALGVLRGSVSADVGSFGTASLSRQKEDLSQWADRLGLLLSADDLPAKVVRGGQEHELFHDEATDRYFKLTRGGVFGMSPGIELALVSSAEEARQFHLWEASPLEYLERLHLQNLLVPGLNTLEGVIVQPGNEMVIVISQPRFDIVEVTVEEIDRWFHGLGFEKITTAGYYREEDNLGIFDAHEKNITRAGEWMVPFDVIPCHPAGGFLQFVRDTRAAGHQLQAVRFVTTDR